MIVHAAIGIVRRLDGRFLMLRRPDGDRAFRDWCFPGGRRDPEESAERNVRREIREETGLEPSILRPQRLEPRRGFSFRSGRGYEIDVFELDIGLPEPRVVLSGEHVEFRWVTPEEAAMLPLAGAATRSVIAELRYGKTLYWPIRDMPPLFPDEPGCFGTRRRNDVHTGIDLYCEKDTLVCAVEAGTVVRIEVFTGPRTVPPSPWWNETHALLVEGASGVINYGEVKPLVEVGQQVEAGQVVAVIETPVLRKFKGRPMVMLHMELMTPGTRETFWWHLDEDRPAALLDPTPLLVQAAGGQKPTFDLATYDQVSFIDPVALEGSPPPSDG